MFDGNDEALLSNAIGRCAPSDHPRTLIPPLILLVPGVGACGNSKVSMRYTNRLATSIPSFRRPLAWAFLSVEV